MGGWQSISCFQLLKVGFRELAQKSFSATMKTRNAPIYSHIASASSLLFLES
jgi:hypothetical protein